MDGFGDVHLSVLCFRFPYYALFVCVVCDAASFMYVCCICMSVRHLSKLMLNAMI